jgi:hypothetical protein
MPKFFLQITGRALVAAQDHFTAASLDDAIAKVKRDGLSAFNFTLEDGQDDGANLSGEATAYLIADGDQGQWKDGEQLAEVPLGEDADALDDADRATILAALRFYQNVGTLNSHDDDGNRLIDDEEGLDDLCERINCGAQPAASDAPAKTDAEIVDLCERAARIALDGFGGFAVPDDFVFHTSSNPRAVKAWGLAVAMVEEIAGHCVQSALAGVEGSTEASHPPRPTDPVKAEMLAALKRARTHLAIYEGSDTLDADRADLAMIDAAIAKGEA